MVNNALLPQGFLPKDSVQLGRFLVNINEPQLAQHDPDININKEKDVLISQYLGFSGQEQNGTGSGFAAGLPGLLSASIKNQLKASTSVAAEIVSCHQLKNSGSFFRLAVRNPATRLWIEEQYDDGQQELFFVVGYYAMKDATVVLGGEGGSNISGKAQIPVSTALAAGGIPLPPGGITDPKVSASYEESGRSRVQFVAQGERICAIQYRKVVFRWFYSGNIDRATLSRDNRWHTVSPARALKGAEEEEEEDVLEVDLEDADDGEESSGNGN